MQLAAETMRATQAIENLCRELALPNMIIGFLKSTSYSEHDQRRFREHVASLKTNGVAFLARTNTRIRKTDLAVAAAIDNLARNGAPESLRENMMQAVSSGVRYTTDLYFEKPALDQPRGKLLSLAIDKYIADDVRVKKCGGDFASRPLCRSKSEF